MNKTIALLGIVMSALQLTGCTVISAVATSTRMEDARTANAGRQLVPKDGGTYLMAVGTETISYLGSGDTDWKINDTSFSQPKGTYSVVRVRPGTYAVFGNKRVAGGGEAASSIEIKEGEAVCFFPVNPISAPARIETYKGDACDPILRALKNLNVIGEVK
jgi:hypothetical protein